MHKKTDRMHHDKDADGDLHTDMQMIHNGSREKTFQWMPVGDQT